MEKTTQKQPATKTPEFVRLVYPIYIQGTKFGTERAWKFEPKLKENLVSTGKAYYVNNDGSAIAI